MLMSTVETAAMAAAAMVVIMVVAAAEAEARIWDRRCRTMRHLLHFALIVALGMFMYSI